MATYTQTTLAALTADISGSLGDPGNVYWSVAEIQLAINEALREWSGTTNYWRERGVFNAAPGTLWYDLSVQVPAIRPRTVTFDYLIRELQFHFCEPSTGLVATGMSSQFSIGEIVTALARGLNRFLQDARMPVVPVTGINGPVSPNSRVLIPQTVIYPHRVAWTDSQGTSAAMHRSEVFVADSELLNWTLSQANRPTAYSMVNTRPVELEVIPAPRSSGTLDLLAVVSQQNTVATVTPTTTLGIPDDFAHAVKYAAMVELLTTDGETASPLLAQYADERYKQVVQAALQHRSVIRVMVNSKPTQLVPIDSLDNQRRFWVNVPGNTDTTGCVYDLLAFSPTPRQQVGITVDVNRSAPIPASQTDFIQLGYEDLDAIVKYAQHYLSLKMQGMEFAQTMPLFDEFQRRVADRNQILGAQSRYLTPSLGAGRAEQSRRPDRVAPIQS